MLTALAHVPFDQIDALYQHPLPLRIHVDHPTALTLVRARKHDNFITTLDVQATHGCSNHLRGQRNDLHELFLAKLARYRPKYARAARVVILVN